MKLGIVALLAMATACGDDDFVRFDGGPPDAGFDGASSDAVSTSEPVAPPIAPSRPAEPQCPDSWMHADDCAPPELPPACGARAYALPGDSECARVGDLCPATGFPSVAGPALYVRPGLGGGDGSAARPFTTIADALSAARAGTTIVLSAGEFSGGVYLPAGVGLLGSCAATVLLGDDDEASGALEFGGVGTFARNLTIRSERQTGVISFRGDGVLEGVTIESAFDVAIYVDGGTVRMRDGRIARPGFHAVAVQSGVLEMENVEITGAMEPQILCAGGQSTFRGVLLRDPRLDDQGSAIGVFASTGAQVDLEDMSVIDAAGSALVAIDADTLVRARRIHVRGTRSANPRDALGQGTGGYVGRDGRLEIQGGAFEENLWGALQSTERGAIEASDLWVRELRNGLAAGQGGFVTVARAFIQGDASCLASQGGDLQAVDVLLGGAGPNDRGNVALFAENGGRLSAVRVVIRECTGYGLLSQGAHAHIEDATFEGIRPLRFARGLEANAIVIEDALSAELRRVRINTLAGAGIVVVGSETTMEDIDIVETRPSEFSGGRAIALTERSVVRADRVRVTDPAGWGIDMYDRSELTLRDYTLVSTSSGPFGFGVALQASGASRADVERASILGSRGLGLWATGSESSVVARDIVIDSTLARTCTMPVCSSAPAGIAVGAYEGSRIQLSGFQIRDATLCGVQVGPSSQVDSSDGQVSGCGVGACVHAADYALSRLTQNVAYQDNGLSIDTVSLPIPEAPAFSRSE